LTLDSARCLQISVVWESLAGEVDWTGRDNAPAVSVLTLLNTQDGSLESLPNAVMAEDLPEGVVTDVNVSLPSGVHYVVFDFSGRNAVLKVIHTQLQNYSCLSSGSKFHLFNLA
jgi:hypothetical protein